MSGTSTGLARVFSGIIRSQFSWGVINRALVACRRRKRGINTKERIILMIKSLKRLFLLIMAATMVLAFIAMPAQTVLAVRFGDVSGLPRGYWSVRGPYDDALSANNSVGITTHGENVINFWLQGNSAAQQAAVYMRDIQGSGYEINELWVTSNRVAEEYEARGDYTNAIRVYRMALAFVDPYQALTPHIGGNPEDMEFARTRIQNWIDAWDVSIELYAEVDIGNGVGDTSYHGALHEPETGIYYGEPPGRSAVMNFDKKPSGIIIYVEFESESLPERVEYDLLLNETQHGYGREGYSIIEIAWNFQNEGQTLRSVPNERAKVTEAAQYLSALGLPVLLRVGAEMNVWENRANPEEYKAAFRFVANIMREHATNVALVWSVNDISAAGLTYDMFYPGAEYVDWVGVSLYSRKYFMGNPNTTDSTAAIWGTGRYANPIRNIDNLVRQYGSRHPIMISEGGVSLYNTSNGENLTTWALPRIRMMYAYIPMLFPEVKAVFWYNVNMQGGAYRYHFSDSPQAGELYGQLTSSGYFLGRGQSAATITYKRLGTETLPANAVTLLAYAPFFTFDDVTVQYRIDNAWVGQSADMPYRLSLDLSGYADGAHTLEVRVLSGGSALSSKSYNLYKNGRNVIVSADAITPAPPTADPLDTADSWARERISAAISKGFVPEDIQDNYRDVITREEFCRMAVSWIEYATGTAIDQTLAGNGLSRNPNAFSDTTNPDILAAFALGILNGEVAPTATSPGIFNPNGDFTRQQAAVMATNTCRAIGVDVTDPPVADFADLELAASWAIAGISFARANGIMAGVTNTPPLLFNPHTTFTRQESILLFDNINPQSLLDT